MKRFNVYGQIQAKVSDAGDECTPAMFETFMGSVKDGEAIELHHNTPGGSVPDALSIANKCAAFKGAVTHVVEGMAASMGAVIACANGPENLKMYRNSFLMIHNPWVSTSGDAESLRSDAALLDSMKARCMEIVGRCFPGKDAEYLSKLMDDETWISGADAEKFGLKCVLIDEDTKMAVLVGSVAFAKAPEAVKAAYSVRIPKASGDANNYAGPYRAAIALAKAAADFATASATLAASSWEGSGYAQMAMNDAIQAARSVLAFADQCEDEVTELDTSEASPFGQTKKAVVGVLDSIPQGGDFPGHPFHGNQHVGGEGGGAEHEASRGAHEASKNAEGKGGHQAAAKAHEKAAALHAKAGNDTTAAYHQAMQHYHLARAARFKGDAVTIPQGAAIPEVVALVDKLTATEAQRKDWQARHDKTLADLRKEQQARATDKTTFDAQMALVTKERDALNKRISATALAAFAVTPEVSTWDEALKVAGSYEKACKQFPEIKAQLIAQAKNRKR